jgi:hypothetical protein
MTRVAARLESEPPPTSAPARPHPKAAKVAGLSALPIALKRLDYAVAREREDKWIFGVEFVGETRWERWG